MKKEMNLTCGLFYGCDFGFNLWMKYSFWKTNSGWNFEFGERTLESSLGRFEGFFSRQVWNVGSTLNVELPLNTITIIHVRS